MGLKSEVKGYLLDPVSSGLTDPLASKHVQSFEIVTLCYVTVAIYNIQGQKLGRS